MDGQIEKGVEAVDVNPTTSQGSLEYIIDAAEEKKVVRKLDLIVMPMLTFVYFFQYVDKYAINYASVFGMNTDLKIAGADFSWAVTLFYCGQLVSEFPSSYLLSRFHVKRVVGVTIILWGATAMCMGAVQNSAGLSAVRFFLGVFEGAASPAWVIMTSNMYTRKEHPIRVAVWTSMSGVASIVGAILMYLIGEAPTMSIANWRIMFIICGVGTIVGGLIFILFMPEDISKAWFLTPPQRRIATERLALDRATRDRSDFNMAQMWEAFTEPRTWLLCLMALFICIPSPILKFSSQVVSGFGFNKFQTMLVGLPSGGLQIILIWVSAFLMRYTKNLRWVVGIVASVIPLIGVVLLLCVSSTASGGWGIIVSTWLAAMSSDLIVITLSLVASNVKGNTKKSTVNAMYFVGYSVGCIVGPQLWQAEDAPRYSKGCISSIVSWALLIVTFVVYYWLCRRENAKRDAMAAEAYTDQGYGEGDNIGVAVNSDLTDTQDVKFRYTL